ncbi:MAG: hypothetical protein D6720_13600 [Gammaproteobacteria bacterium]|nr:MAG: hypothetical protein D6720_13600 [Gammaproteobacteria bacterium]
MHKAGVVTFWLGLILTLFGLGVGFWRLFAGSEDAMRYMSAVPLGFVLMFAGLVATQLSGSGRR